MSKRTLTPEESSAFTELEELVRKAEEARSQVLTHLLAHTRDERIRLATASRIIERLDRASLQGLAYELHPQHEWIGGDSMNPNNFRTMNPHIDR